MAGIFQSVADIFRPTTQVTMAPPPHQPMSQPNPGANPDAVPPPGSAQNQPGEPANPLDNFSKIWETPTPEANTDPFATPLLNSDPAQIREAAGKMNFTQGISQEQVSKALGGDVGAFMQVLNKVVQNSTAVQAQLSTATVERAIGANNGRVFQALPSKVRDVQLAGLTPENPVLQHPAAQPMLHMMRGQIAANNPGMSAADVNKQAEQFLGAFATQFQAPAQQAAQQAQASRDPENYDWSNFL
jgi:hypothetical protein